MILGAMDMRQFKGLKSRNMHLKISSHNESLIGIHLLGIFNRKMKEWRLIIVMKLLVH